MKSNDNSDSKVQHSDNTIKRLHILVFFTLFFLLMTQIYLVMIGLSSTCCVGVLIVLLLLNSSFFWHRQKIYRIRREEFAKKSSSSKEVIDLPKVYDFFCPKCLFQTNEDVEYCPNCKTGKLTPTSKDHDLWNK